MSINEKEFSFEIKEHVGVIGDYSSGWTKELNLVSWNDGKAKYDIRDWNEDHEHMSRGVTMHPKEVKALQKILSRVDYNSIAENEKVSKASKEDDSFPFEIIEHIGILGDYASGWTKELNLVSWNGAKAKFDIRDWNEDHEHMSRGITLKAKEIKALSRVVSKIEM
ncbi:MAG: YdbC family protein [Anaerovoracaceae bacterium]